MFICGKKNHNIIEYGVSRRSWILQNYVLRIMGYIVLIPAYKPSEKLVELIDELNADNIRTLVVNDGSGSEYDAIIRQGARTRHRSRRA